jgi:hypothetical protein
VHLATQRYNAGEEAHKDVGVHAAFVGLVDDNGRVAAKGKVRFNLLHQQWRRAIECHRQKRERQPPTLVIRQPPACLLQNAIGHKLD